MKILQTKSFEKVAKSKYPKSETEPYNPWAVCNKSTGGKKESPEKFERCVHHVKDQNKGEKKKKSKEDETKPAFEGQVYTPSVENDYVDELKKHRIKGRKPLSEKADRARMNDKDWARLVRKHKCQSLSPGRRIIIEAKKKK